MVQRPAWSARRRQSAACAAFLSTALSTAPRVPHGTVPHTHTRPPPHPTPAAAAAEAPAFKGDLLNKTYYPTAADASNATKRWYIIDAQGQTLGRLATLAATYIRGKHLPTYSPSMDMGAYVIVINAEKVRRQRCTGATSAVAVASRLDGRCLRGRRLCICWQQWLQDEPRFGEAAASSGVCGCK